MLGALRVHEEKSPVVFLDSTGQLVGFAKSFALEHPNDTILFVHYEEHSHTSAGAIAAELPEAFSFREVRYNETGCRFMTRCCLIDNDSAEPLAPLSSNVMW